LQLREKQKAKIIYGVLEAQFKRYFRLAERKKGVTSDNLVVLLERRLDNVVFKLGFAGSRSAARQLTTHNHILVNQKRVNIPSYLVKVGDVIEIREKSRNIVRAHLQSKIEKEVPSWLQLSSDRLKGTVLRIPTRAEIEPLYDPQSIVEFYSK
jgi:small subunit ribosomal protein S4